jgi:type IV secretion system protein VirB11
MTFAPRADHTAGEAVTRLPPAVHDCSALDLTLRALRPILTDHAVTELCINRPGEAFIETREGWRCVPLPFADFKWCTNLAKLVANSTRQRIDPESPLLSASLPGGERIQIVVPPAAGS